MANTCTYNTVNECSEATPFCDDTNNCVAECTDKYYTGNYCVTDCPTEYPYINGTACLGACPTGFTANSEKECIANAKSKSSDDDNGILNIDWEDLWTQIIKWCTSTGLRIIIAIILLIICFKIINFICRRLFKVMKNRDVDITLCKVGSTTLKYLLKLLVVVSLITYVGIETASISALVAAFGVALGLALQGALANLAGGIIIIVTRPFVIGDYIVSTGEEGTVEDIKLFYTYIRTVDNCLVFIPNGTLANGVIVNKSVKPTRRVDIIMSVAYSTNIELAKNVLLKTCKKNRLVLKDPAPEIHTCCYASSSIDLTVRSWCNNADYWTVYWDLMEDLKKALDSKGIEIPFTQVDLNVNAPIDLNVKKRTGSDAAAKKEE